MRYQLKADVKGHIFILSPISIDCGDYRFEFLPSETGQLEFISVSKEVPADRIEEFRGSIQPADGDTPISITIGTDLHTHQELVDQLQMVESALAYSSGFALQKINWDTPDQEYVGETEEDQDILGVSAFSYERSYPQTPAVVKEDTLVPLIQLAPDYNELRVVKAFWREGMAHFQSFQYVQAFYQFYFVIEDFFASGKSGKNAVMSEFRKSRDFIKQCERSLQETLKDSRHSTNLRQYFENFNCEESAQGLAELLFEMRGALHHYSSRSIRAKGTPFNQKDFETIALLTMHLVTSAIAFREVAISKSLTEMPRQ